MRVHHIFSNIFDKTKGPANSVPALCKGLAERGIDVTLHTLGQHATEERGAYTVRTHPAERGPRGLGRSSSLYKALRQAARNVEILHTHSLWTLPTLYPHWVSRGTSCHVVVSPRGTLAPWALSRSRWKKRLMWTLATKRALTSASCLHATAESECRQFRDNGLRNPVAIIPNGIAMPSLRPRDLQARKQLLFLGRIHPNKGIDLLLHAWKLVEGEFGDWDLRIVGPDNNGYLAEMQALARSLRVKRVVFSGGLVGVKKDEAFRLADLFILPSHSESFGLAIAEALSHGIPAIVTKGAPWQALEKEQCGWWIDIGVQSLVNCMRHAMKLPQRVREEMGARGRSWVDKEYSLSRTAEMMHQTYNWLVGRQNPPPWIDFVDG